MSTKNFQKVSDKYELLSQSKANCKECEQYNHYQCVVQSEGNVDNPTFMVLGECPGKTETEQHRPMVGPAGQVLRERLREFGFTKKNTVITNVMPCRPLNNQFPKNWDIVQSCCEKWLYKEIGVLKPKIIIACGAPALRAITGKTGVGANRGRWQLEYRFQAYILPTWHPSYVMRCSNDPNKQHVPIEFKNDIKKVSVEWQYIYSDKRLHMDKNSYNKEVTEQEIQTLLSQMQ